KRFPTDFVHRLRSRINTDQTEPHFTLFSDPFSSVNAVRVPKVRGESLLSTANGRQFAVPLSRRGGYPWVEIRPCQTWCPVLELNPRDLGWLSTLHLILVVICIPVVLVKKRDSTVAVAWCLTVLLAPIFGALLFWGFGFNYVQKRVKRKQVH